MKEQFDLACIVFGFGCACFAVIGQMEAACASMLIAVPCIWVSSWLKHKA